MLLGGVAASILETAFVRYLRTLPIHSRVEHLSECAIDGGELFYELATHFKEFNPWKLSILVENEDAPTSQNE